MKYKKIYLFVCLLICVLSMASVCAGEANDTAMASENSLEIGQTTDDAISLDEDTGLASSDENEVLTADGLSFAQLNTTINGNENNEIYLNRDYKYCDGDDSFINGIEISRDVTIYGKGHKIDGSGCAGIFNVKSGNVSFINVEFYNSGHTAVTGSCYAISCTFKDNIGDDGGAMNGGYAIDCSFSGNLAVNGGAMYNGAAKGCNFTRNIATECGGATYGVSVTLCYFNQNKALNDGGAVYNGNAENTTFEDNAATNNGGAICNGNATGSTFVSNIADNGGAMYNGRAAVSKFSDNCANNDGGAIYKGNSLNSNFTQNIAGRYGGAICYGGLFASTFTSNFALYGGAVAYGYLENCICIGNNAHSDTILGKEIGGEGGATYRCNVSFSTFTDNVASKNGGAISWGDAFVCTFTGNREEGALGAMCHGEATLCTFGDGQLNPDKVTVNQVNLTVADTAVGYNSNQKLDFYLIRNGKVYGDRFNTTIKVYEGGRLVGTYYGVNGYPDIEDYNVGWVVTLEKGDYIVELILDNVVGVNGASARLRVINATSINASDLNATYNSDSSFEAIMTYENGKSAAGAILSVDLNGKLKSYTADESGRIMVPVRDLPAGTYEATVSFPGNHDYARSSATAKITVNKAATQLNADSISVAYNSNGQLVVSLRDSEGNPVAGADIAVDLNGAKTFTTDKNGQARISANGLVPDVYTARISFNGNGNYLGSAKDVKVTVKKASAKITAKKKTFNTKKTKKYTITLKDSTGKVIKKAKVTLKVGKKTYRATTNAKGKAVFKIKNLTKKGKYTAKITYKGNYLYKKASKKVKIVIK